MNENNAKEIKITIDTLSVSCKSDQTILEVAKENGIDIPTLCFLKNLNEPAGCRVCVVEVEGIRNLVPACKTKVFENMVVKTGSDRVLSSRKTTVELLLSNHNKDCLSCSKNLKCKLQAMSKKFGCDEHKYAGAISGERLDLSSKCITRDDSKCILCGKCVSVCAKRMASFAINKIGRGFESKVGCAYDEGFENSTCIGCGQCVLVCPTGALMEQFSLKNTIEYLNNPEYETVVQVAPAVRVAIAEEFGYDIGTFSEGKLAAALRRLGFDHIYDVNIAADFTIVEESKELVDRIKNKTGPMPMFTSCCPGWYNYVELVEPGLLDNLSTCKSPNEMLGSLVRYHHKQISDKPLKIIAVMPCTAKKKEITRHGEVNEVITTRELAQLIKHKNINFDKLPDEEFDQPFGIYSTAGLIFGVSGGVMEAALRTVSSLIGSDEKIDFETVRYSPGRKEVQLKTPSGQLNLAIISGIANARELIEDIKSGKTNVDFVEVMACPGGCINGGGQPFVDYDEIDLKEVIEKRTSVIYNKDKKSDLRSSHQNQHVLDVYNNLLKNDHELIHSLLHVNKR